MGSERVDEMKFGGGRQDAAQHHGRRRLVHAYLHDARSAAGEFTQQRRLTGRVHGARRDQPGAHRHPSYARVVAQRVRGVAAQRLRERHELRRGSGR